jgi:hypothetical protein
LGRPEYKPPEWDTRGWTFQEDLFSGRKLIFDDDCVRWHCQTVLCYEDSLTSCSGYSRQTQATDRLLLALHPNMASLRNLLQSFNCREFSFPEDVLKAFWCTATALTASFNGGFIWGLPAVFFDIALLWQLQDEMYRRTGRSEYSQMVWLPSWSWAGWSGRMDS